MFWGSMKQLFPSKCSSCHRVPGPLGWLDQAQGSVRVPFSCTGKTPSRSDSCSFIPGAQGHILGPVLVFWAQGHPRPPALCCAPLLSHGRCSRIQVQTPAEYTLGRESPHEKVAERCQPQRPPTGNPNSCLARRSWALGPDPRLAVAVSGVQRSWGR